MFNKFGADRDGQLIVYDVIMMYYCQRLCIRKRFHVQTIMFRNEWQ